MLANMSLKKRTVVHQPIGLFLIRLINQRPRTISRQWQCQRVMGTEKVVAVNVNSVGTFMWASCFSYSAVIAMLWVCCGYVISYTLLLVRRT